MAPLATVRKWDRREHLVIGLIFAGGFINYLDRTAFGVLAPAIAKDLSLSPSRLGLVFGAFSAGYTLAVFFGGWAADRFGAARVISAAMSGWSLVCILIGAATNMPTLVALRFMFGVGEAPWAPASNRLLAQWFPAATLQRALAFTTAALPLGAAAAGPIAGFMVGAAGWRAAFFALGALGVVWTLTWISAGRDHPPQRPRPAYGGAIQEQVKEGWTWRYAFVVIAFAASTYSLSFFVSWFPSYLRASRGFDQLATSLVVSLPWLAGVAGTLLGGAFADRIAAVIKDSLRGRTLAIGISLVAAAGAIVVVAMTTNALLAVSAAVLAVGCLYMAGPVYWPVLVAILGVSRLGRSTGFMIMVGSGAGAVSPIVTGFLVERSHGFELPMLVAAATTGAGAMLAVLSAIRGSTHLASSEDR